MADQASVSATNGVKTQPPSPGSIIGNVAWFGNDIAALGELQAKLAAHDAKECVGRATTPLIVLGAVAAVALGSVPIILLGLADVVATAMGREPGSVRLVIGLLALVVAGVVGYLALRAATASVTSFRRSREELTRNVSWIKSVLAHSGRLAPRHRV